MAGSGLVFLVPAHGLGLLPGDRPPVSPLREDRRYKPEKRIQNRPLDTGRYGGDGFIPGAGLPAERAGGNSDPVFTAPRLSSGDGEPRPVESRRGGHGLGAGRYF